MDVRSFFEDGMIVAGSDQPKAPATLPPNVHLQTGLAGIWGDDDRRIVTNTSEVPWRKVCCLDIQFPKPPPGGQKVIGTGTMLGPRIVVTAAHCVFNRSFGGLAKQITVTPGHRGSSDNGPFGVTIARRFKLTKGWVETDSKAPPAVRVLSPYDYAAILLDTDLGKRTGWMSFASPAPQAVSKFGVNNAGYPVDKPLGTLWKNNNWVLKATDRRLFYRLDTYAGQSGSPIWLFDANTKQRIMVGIHTSFVGTNNSAVRVSRTVRDKLIKWKQASSAG